MYESWKDGKGDAELDKEEVADVAARLSFSRALDIKISPRLMSSSGVTGDGAVLLPRDESELNCDLSRCFQGCRHSCKSGWAPFLKTQWKGKKRRDL